MTRALTFLYGLLCYLAFLAAFIYAIGFVAGLGVPRSIDTGPTSPLPRALAIDLALLTLFAVQHSGMARPAFKRWWTRVIPHPIERSTYVLAASAVLALLFWAWQPLPQTVWQIEQPPLRAVLWAVSAAGWLTVLLGTFAISHAHLFGLSQVWDRLRGRECGNPSFQTRGPYRFVRHPLMAGFLVAFWATPTMSLGHLLFAAVTTAYIVIATLRFEEPDLERALGDPYRRYRSQVPAFLPRLGRSAPQTTGLREPAGSGMAPAGRPSTPAGRGR